MAERGQGPSTWLSASFAEMLQRKSLSLSRCRAVESVREWGGRERTSRLHGNSRVIFSEEHRRRCQRRRRRRRAVKSAGGSRACQPPHILWAIPHFADAFARTRIEVTRCSTCPHSKFVIPPLGQDFFISPRSQFAGDFVSLATGTRSIASSYILVIECHRQFCL